MPVQCICLLCDKPFSVKPSKISNGRGRYCSAKCARTGQWVGRTVPNYRPIGSTTIQPMNARDGARLYRKVKIADPGVWEWEHRVVMVAKLGRPLRSGEQVHHINHDGLDNRPENLEVLSIGDHGRKELSLNGRWSRRYAACVVCEKTSAPHASHGRCSRCLSAERKRRQKL